MTQRTRIVVLVDFSPSIPCMFTTLFANIFNQCFKTFQNHELVEAIFGYFHVSLVIAITIILLSFCAHILVYTLLCLLLLAKNIRKVFLTKTHTFCNEFLF